MSIKLRKLKIVKLPVKVLLLATAVLILIVSGILLAPKMASEYKTYRNTEIKKQLEAVKLEPANIQTSETLYFKGNETPKFKLSLPKKQSFLPNFGITKVFAEDSQYRSGDLSIKTSLIYEAEEAPRGEVDVLVEKSQDQGSNELTVSLVPRDQNHFRPGKYQVQVEVKGEDQTKTINQDFIWGVLAINSDKSVYLPSDEAYLQMASLDELGHTLCNSDLLLEITDPKGHKTTPEIIKSNTCGVDNVTDNPDYFADYQIGAEIGTYQMKLTNRSNNFTTEDSFEVKTSVPFVVERSGATRINPYLSTYGMTIKITANQDFEGEIIESLPQNFEITDDGGGKTENIIEKQIDKLTKSPNKSVQTITWKKKLTNGEQITLRYEYQAPTISPELFTLGPLRLDLDSKETVFEEARIWQLASDAACVTAGTGNWNADATWTTCREGTATPWPLAGDTVSITINLTQTVTVPNGFAAASGAISFTSSGILVVGGGTSGSLSATSITVSLGGPTFTVAAGATANISGTISLPNIYDANMFLSLNGAGTLTVDSISIGGASTPSYTNDTQLLSTIGTLNVTTISTTCTDGASGTRRNDPKFLLASGIVNVSSTITLCNGSSGDNKGRATFTMNTGAGTGTLNLSSTANPIFIMGDGGLAATTFTSGLVNYSGASATVRTTTYYDLTLSGATPTWAVTTINRNFKVSTDISIGANLTVGGLTTVDATKTLTIGSTYTFSTYALTVNGTLEHSGSGTFAVTYATSSSATAVYGNLTLSGTGNQTFTAVTIYSGGTLTDSNASGTNTYGVSGYGSVNINSGGTFTTSNNPAFTFKGNFTNNGTFTSGTGTYTFSTNSFYIYGSSTITFNGTVLISGVIWIYNSVTAPAELVFAGDLTGDNAGSTLYQSNLATFSGAVLTTGALSVPSSGTTTYNGVSQTVKPPASSGRYYNLVLSGSGTVVLTNVPGCNGNFTVSGTVTTTTNIASWINYGTVTVNAGATLTAANGTSFSVTGTTTIGGTFNLSGAGNEYFTGLITINSGGILNATASSSTHNLRGGLTNNGTFTGGTGTFSFDTNSQALAGDQPITFGGIAAIVGAITLTNNNTNTVTVTGNLTGNNDSSNFAPGANSDTHLGGTVMTTGILTPSASANTVDYTGASQTVEVPTTRNYYHLTLSGSGTPVLTSITGTAGNFTTSGTVTPSTAGNFAVSGNLSVGSGTTLTIASTRTLAVTGTTTVTGNLTVSSSGNQTHTGATTIQNGGVYTRSSASGTNLFVGLLTINSGGTWTNSNNPAFTLRGGLTNDGTFTSGTGTYTFNTNNQALGGGAAITFGGIAAISGAITLTNNNTSTVTVTGNLTGDNAASNFAPGAGSYTKFMAAVMTTGILTPSTSAHTCEYSGAGLTVEPPTTNNYYHLTLSGSGTPTLTSLTGTNGNLTTSGTVTASLPGNFTVGGGVIVGSGTTLTSASTYTLAVTGNSTVAGGLTLSSSGDQTFTGTTTIQNGGTLTDSNASGTNLYVGLVTIDSGGTWTNSNNPAFTFRGGLSNSGTFTSGSGTYTFNTNNQSIGGTAATTFSGVVAISGAITVGSNNTAGVTINGNLTGDNAASTWQNSANGVAIFKAAVLATGAVDSGASGNSITYSGTSAQTVKAGTYYNLNVQPAADSITDPISAGTLTVNGTLTLGNGTNANTVIEATTNDPNITIPGNMTVSANTTFTGSDSASATLNIDGNLTITGTFTAPTGTGATTFTIGGNMTNNGTFTHSSGTVTFDTASQASVLGGSGTPAITFYNLTVATGSKIMKFTAGKTFRINGAFTVTGSSKSQVNLVSATPGTQWLINNQGAEAVTYAFVQDGGCSTSADITMDITSLNGGNNGTCWVWSGSSGGDRGTGRVKGTTRIMGTTRVGSP